LTEDQRDQYSASGMVRRFVAEVIIVLAILPFSAPFITCSLGDFEGRDSSSVAVFDIKSPAPLDETRSLDLQEDAAVHRQFTNWVAVALIDLSIIDEVTLDEDTLQLIPQYRRSSGTPLVALRV
jgi:hypothetical protein